MECQTLVREVKFNALRHSRLLRDVYASFFLTPRERQGVVLRDPLLVMIEYPIDLCLDFGGWDWDSLCL